MNMRTLKAPLSAAAVAVLVLLLLSACGPESDNPSEASDPAGSRTGLTAEELAVDPPSDEIAELDWDALIPEDWRPEKLLEGLSTDGTSLDDISDDDPRAVPIMQKLMELWQQAPVVDALEGTRVKLPGFVVPLQFDLNDVSEFLLVPYYGACIHVPPPPANQTVHVVLPKGDAYNGGVFDTVWVTGILKIERFSSEMADAGYRLEAFEIAPYP